MGMGGRVGIADCAPEKRFNFNIPSGDIRAALEQFASFTDSQIGFDARLTGTTQGVHGRHTTEEGLMILLGGTGLLCERFPGRPEISVHRAGDEQPRRTCLVSTPTSSSEPVLPAPEELKSATEIEVHGKRPLGTHSHYTDETGSLLMSWDEEQIRITGAQVIADVLDSTTQNFEGGPTQDTHYGSTEAGDNSGLATGANLRALGSRSTLVLFNGHRVALSGVGASFADLLQFPLAVTTKLSVMPDSASGVYGTEAVGGVINIESLDHYVRPESHLEFGTVTDGHQSKYRFSQQFGLQWEGGSALAVAELVQWDRLPASARSQANSARVPYADPGNLITSAGTYPIPAGQSGPNLDVSTLALGPPHMVDPQLAADILPSQKRWALYGSLDHQFSPSIRLWTYVLGTERYGGESWGGQEVYLNVSQSPFLLHSPAGPIFEEYNLLPDIGPQIVAVNVRTINAAMELQFNLSGDWFLVLSGSDSVETETLLTTGQLDPGGLQDEVSSPQVGNAFDPFWDGYTANASVLKGLDVPKWFGSRSQVRSFEWVADGPLFSLWGEPLFGAVGFEARDQRFTWALSQPADTNDLRRLLYAGFAELKVPLLAESTFAAPFRNLAISLAGRVERYRDFGKSATPRIGVSWAPVSHLELRAAWARSVRAPDLGNLSQKTNSSLAATLGDTSALIWSGGNPSLSVEQALTRTIGLKISSDPSLPRFSFDLGYFDILSRDRIEPLSLTETILSDPQYSSFVTHNPDSSLQHYVCNNSTFIGGTHDTCLQFPTGAIVDLRLHNVGRLWTDGIDTMASVSLDSAIGSWGADLASTYILHYRQATGPNAPLASALDTESNLLALHVLGTITWKWRDARADLTARYQNGYHNSETQPTSHVGSWTTTDLRLAYTFGTKDSPTAHPTELAVFVKNLFDKYPPFSDDVLANVGYDQENGDLSGRLVSVSVHVKW